MMTGVLLALCLGQVAFNPSDTNSWAFPTKGRTQEQPSPIDLRHLNEPVAGVRGPLRKSRDGNDLVYADGRPFRGWMVHLPHGCDYEFTKDTWAAKDYVRSSRWLAGYGVNLGIMGPINPGMGQKDPLAVSPVVLEMLHRTLAGAKSAGIYTQLRVGWFHGITGKALGIAGHEERDLQCLLFFHPRVQAAWKSWTRGMLTPVNPYTGLALKDDPSLFSIEIANEDSLLFWVTDTIQGEARAELERQFFEFCRRKYGSAEQALSAWSGDADPKDDAKRGRLGIIITWRLTREGRKQGHPERARDQLEFLVETSQKWNREAKRFIQQEVGAKHVLVAGSNFVPADRVIMDDALRLLTWQDMDVIENNVYCTDGGKPSVAFWRADAGSKLGLRSVVRFPSDLPTNKRQVEGKPFFVTEILWPRPHPFEVEGPLLVAAYQCLSGIDGLAWAGPRDLTWEGREQAYFTVFNHEGSSPLKPFACAGPSTIGQFPAAAAIVRLGLVKPGPVLVSEVRTKKQILDGEAPLTAEDFAYDPNQFAKDERAEAPTPRSPSLAVFLGGQVRTRLAAQPSAPSLSSQTPSASSKSWASATSELKIDPQRGLFTLDAPAAKAVAGFLRRAGRVKLSGVELQGNVYHGTLAIVALDAKPIEQSKRILIQTGARAVPTGWKETPTTWDDQGKTKTGLEILATGDLPWRVENATFEVVLPKGRFQRATALDGNGLPGKPLTLLAVDHGRRRHVLIPAGVMYAVLD